MQMDSKKLALICRKFAEHKKGENVVVLDMRQVSSITDFFVLTSGTSEPHLRAISDEIQDKLREDYGVRPRAVDGSAETSWIVLDYFDVIIHVMKRELRQHYDLEGLWGDALRLRGSGSGGKRRPGVAKPPYA